MKSLTRISGFLRAFGLALFLAILAAGGSTNAAVRDQLVDVNHASIEALETLPGIQQAFAEKIVRNRTYANKTQLLSKGVIPAATYKRIRTLIIAKQ